MLVPLGVCPELCLQTDGFFLCRFNVASHSDQEGTPGARTVRKLNRRDCPPDSSLVSLDLSSFAFLPLAGKRASPIPRRPRRANLRRPPVAEISAKVRSSETSGLPCGEPRRLRMRMQPLPAALSYQPDQQYRPGTKQKPHPSQARLSSFNHIDPITASWLLSVCTKRRGRPFSFRK